MAKRKKKPKLAALPSFYTRRPYRHNPPKPLGRRQQRKLGLLPKPIVIPQPDGTHKVIR
ncbi:MAG: hypothetical protein V3W44_08685 [Dehalococcoidales bacterium]